VTDEERASYTRIIDGILADADLETVTRKKIRQGLEEAIDKDLSDQKVCARRMPFSQPSCRTDCRPNRMPSKP
jgi:upstream activation factor subunit UAF30